MVMMAGLFHHFLDMSHLIHMRVMTWYGQTSLMVVNSITLTGAMISEQEMAGGEITNSSTIQIVTCI